MFSLVYLQFWGSTRSGVNWELELQNPSRPVVKDYIFRDL
jgi:hypothetical protein